MVPCKLVLRLNQFSSKVNHDMGIDVSICAQKRMVESFLKRLFVVSCDKNN